MERAGTYEFELHRWPRELDLPLPDAEEARHSGERLLFKGDDFTRTDVMPAV